jgi:hypothetical protein
MRARRASSNLQTGGKTFTSFRTPHGDNHDIWISPKDGNIMIQSNDGGANVSDRRRPDVVVAEQSGDRRDLRRHRGQRVPVQHLRGAAGHGYTLIMTSQAAR